MTEENEFPKKSRSHVLALNEDATDENINVDVDILRQWRIQDFPREAPTPKGGGAHLLSWPLSPKPA